MPDLSHALGLPPEKVIEYLGGKDRIPTEHWAEMWQEAHAKAFTVARSAKYDILGDIHGMLRSAAAEGMTFQQFRKELEPRLRAKGWWGKVEELDEKTGELVPVQLGSVRRLKTIYRTNLDVAYNAGRYREQMDNIEGQPFWQYLAIMDRRTRPSHGALNGRVFPATDPFWDSHYPPNGWGCRCRVSAISSRSMERKGLKAESSEGLMTTEERLVSKKTGEMAKVKVFNDPVTGKKFAPDPGWSYNPGKAWGAGRDRGVLKEVPGQKTWKNHGRPDLRDVPEAGKTPAPAMLPAGKTKAEAVKIVTSALGITPEIPTRIIQTPIEQVAAREELIEHMVEKRDATRERYANFILPTLVDPFEVYLTEHEGGVFRTRYIGLFAGKADILVVVDQRADGSLFWNFMQRNDKDMNKARVGELLHWRK